MCVEVACDDSGIVPVRPFEEGMKSVAFSQDIVVEIIKGNRTVREGARDAKKRRGVIIVRR
jgi:hypothetical protein